MPVRSKPTVTFLFSGLTPAPCSRASSVTFLVTPCSVSSPVTLAWRGPVTLTLCEVKRISGFALASSQSAAFSSSVSLSTGVFTEAVGSLMSKLLLAGLAPSSCSVPETSPNRPRKSEKPICDTTKPTWVWSGSIA